MNVSKIVGADLLRAAINREDKEAWIKINNMPGWHVWASDEMLISPTAENIEYIVREFPGAAWGEDCAAYIREYYNHNPIKTADQILKEMKGERFDFVTEPKLHQRLAFEKGKDKPYFAYFMGPGTGKSKVVVDRARYLYKSDKIRSHIIFAPKGVHIKWIKTKYVKHARKPEWTNSY